MAITNRLNRKQTEKHDFSCCIILDRLRDSRIINGMSGIRMPSVDFVKKLVTGGIRIFEIQE